MASKSDPRLPDVLEFIATQEPLRATLNQFPDMKRSEIRQLLLSLDSRTSRKAPKETPLPVSVDEVFLNTDGAARGNPGPAGAGVFVSDRAGNSLLEDTCYLGETTNNVAEYEALLLGLRRLVELAPSRATVRLDSELIVKQLNGLYQVKSPHLKPLYLKAKQLLSRLETVRVVHVRREKNREADALANRAIDEHFS